MKSSLAILIRRATLAFAAALMMVCIANGQTTTTSQTPGQVATAVNSSRTKAAPSNAPVYTDYRGISIGMAATDVRAKFDRIEKGDRQDYLVSSQRETAQIYYDGNGKVTAVSIDYFGDESKAPTAEAVLGTSVEPKPDGSMYQMKRYPQAGYWVSYNRTAGDKPVITITMQKM